MQPPESSTGILPSTRRVAGKALDIGCFSVDILEAAHKATMLTMQEWLKEIKASSMPPSRRAESFDEVLYRDIKLLLGNVLHDCMAMLDPRNVPASLNRIVDRQLNYMKAVIFALRWAKNKLFGQSEKPADVQ